MKRTVLGIGAGLLATCAIISCGGGEKKTDQASPAVNKEKPTTTVSGTMPNYRFVNFDSINAKYNLCIDFNEQFIKQSNSLSEEEKRQTNALNSKGESFQKKYQAAASSQTEPLQSEVESLKKEYESLQNEANNAQQKIAKMASDLESTQMKNLQTIMDSVQNFLNDYAKKHGYDAVFFSNQTGYFDPALDVTDEVIEGLNKRYNKVK